MKKNYLLTLTLFLFAVVGGWAQTVTGTVTDDSGDPLIGVNVIEVGTQNGTITDIDGNYSIELITQNPSLQFSYTGYANQTVEVAGRPAIDVTLQEGVALDEVVVTALGISREKKALGYSVSEVDGSELTEARENSVIRQLSGKIAGVTVNNAATGPAGSSRVVIRGNSSLGGSNQPLYVIDGIPIDNSNLGGAGMWGGIDLGDGLSSINQDDIESITVLKGPSATALYGTRAQNGVIQITTKKGSRRKGLGVEFNSNFVTEQPLDFYQDVQTSYGSGSEGVRPQTQEEALNNTRSSWGERLDGADVIQFDGSTAPYVHNGSAIDQIYNNGQTWNNTLALSGGNEDATFRLSASDLRNDGMFENTGYNRNTISARGTSNLGNDFITVDAKITYINERADNRPALSDSPHNPGHLNEVATSVNLDILKQTDPVTGEYDPLYSPSIFRVNPYFGVYQQFNGDKRDRLQGFALARMNFTDWLSLQLRAGTDWYTFRQTQWDGERTPHLNRPGRMWEREYRIRENNYDFLLNFNKQIGSDFSISANAGGNLLTQSDERLTLFGNEFIIEGLRAVNNTKFPSQGYSIREKEIHSLYGSVQLGFRNYLYLDLTARNDWSSTLPEQNNSYFYPSASLSFIFTDAFNIPSNILSFGKMRFSAAEVGGDTDPYRLDLTYSVVGQPHLGNPQGQIAQGNIPLKNLRPTSTRSIEAGLDLRFFNGRIGLDVTYYNMSTQDQILSTTVSPTSGYGSVTVNAGEIQNRGWEVLLTGSPISSQSGFNWDVSLNFARNVNEVVALDDEGKLTALRLGQARTRNTFVEARLGQPYGAIVGRPYRRNDAGDIVYDQNGLPLQGDLEILGVGVPDWTSGITNTFSWKGLSFSALLDLRFGAELHSMTNWSTYSTGRHINTLEKGVPHPQANHPSQADVDARAGWFRSEQEREAAGVAQEDWAPTGGVYVSGVNEDGEDFARFVDPQVYYGNVASRISEEFIYSADFIKMRQMTLSYTLPRRWIQSSPFQNVTVSLVGRNLFFLYKNVPNIDPEASYNTGNGGQGLEYATIPTARSFGFNVNLRF